MKWYNKVIIFVMRMFGFYPVIEGKAICINCVYHHGRDYVDHDVFPYHHCYKDSETEIIDSVTGGKRRTGVKSCWVKNHNGTCKDYKPGSSGDGWVKT